MVGCRRGRVLVPCPPYGLSLAMFRCLVRYRLLLLLVSGELIDNLRALREAQRHYLCCLWDCFVVGASSRLDSWFGLLSPPSSFFVAL